MKKKKRHRVLPVFLVMVAVISLLSGCGEKSTEKEDADTITVYLWSTNLYEKYASYIQEQLPDIITCCRFSLHDASPLKDSLMDLSTTNAAGAVCIRTVFCGRT